MGYAVATLGKSRDVEMRGGACGTLHITLMERGSLWLASFMSVTAGGAKPTEVLASICSLCTGPRYFRSWSNEHGRLKPMFYRNSLDKGTLSALTVFYEWLQSVE